MSCKEDVRRATSSNQALGHANPSTAVMETSREEIGGASRELHQRHEPNYRPSADLPVERNAAQSRFGREWLAAVELVDNGAWRLHGHGRDDQGVRDSGS